MAIKTFIDCLQRRVRELRTANGANVTITFALATIPIIGFVGAAVDYSHANSVKTSLQAATDATALMLSKTASTLSNAQLQTQAFNYLQAVFNRPEATGLAVKATYSTTSGQQVVVLASANLKANFMSMAGISTMKVGADSQVSWGNTRLRVALVLDNTGSMKDDGKMPALVGATKTLLNQLKAAAVNKDDVYVSIIPFVKDVNVDPKNKGKKWIDWTEWDRVNGSCSSSSYGNQDDCESAGKKWNPDNHDTWNGCVMDRGNTNGPSTDNYDQNVTAPTATITATLYASEQYGSCPKAAVMALNNDWTAMADLVDSMTPNGMTNQGIGLQLGWQSLVGGGPFKKPPAMDQNYKYTQAIILMSDGLNTQNRWYSDPSKIDARQATTCANAKAAGITVYAIHVNTGGDPMSTLLKNCASSPDKFWMLTNASQMTATFQQIGTALSNLRISQ